LPKQHRNADVSTDAPGLTENRLRRRLDRLNTEFLELLPPDVQDDLICWYAGNAAGGDADTPHKRARKSIEPSAAEVPATIGTESTVCASDASDLEMSPMGDELYARLQDKQDNPEEAETLRTLDALKELGDLLEQYQSDQSGGSREPAPTSTSTAASPGQQGESRQRDAIVLMVVFVLVMFWQVKNKKEGPGRVFWSCVQPVGRVLDPKVCFLSLSS
jgi:hypothetical protein